MTDFVEDCKQRVARGEKLTDLDRELAANLVMIDGLAKMYRGAPIREELRDAYFRPEGYKGMSMYGPPMKPYVRMDPMADMKYIHQRFSSMSAKEAAETGFFGEGATEKEVRRTLGELGDTINLRPTKKRSWFSRLRFWR